MRFWKRIWRTLRGTSAQLGREGEDAVVERLSRRVGRGGRILRNVYLPLGEGRTTEIDILYLTRKGIFVLESKNYSGCISGAPSQPEWQVHFYRGRTWFGREVVETHTFYNPLRQNETHRNALRAFLGPSVPLFSVVVFSDRCKLGRTAFFSPEQAVCQQKSLRRCLRKIRRRHPKVFSRKQVETLYETLLPLTHPGRRVKRQHIRDVRKGPPKMPRCPECGAPLVLRTARNGPRAGHRFYGCSQYPACRYTENLDSEP